MQEWKKKVNDYLKDGLVGNRIDKTVTNLDDSSNDNSNSSSSKAGNESDADSSSDIFPLTN